MIGLINFWRMLAGLFVIGWLTLEFKKQSSSSASSANTTTNIDKRLVVGESAIGVSADGSNVNVNVLDGGAIGQSFGFAKSALEGVVSTAAASQGNIMQIAGEALGQVAMANEHVVDKIAGAYSEAKAGEQKILVAVGVVAVVIVVVAVAARK